MKQLEYRAYIESDEWAERRRRWFAAHGKFCRGCDSGSPIQLHHLSYERLGDEPDVDLVAVCQDCHRQIHEGHAAMPPGTTLRMATHAVLRSTRGEREPEIRKPFSTPRRRKTGHTRVAGPLPANVVTGFAREVLLRELRER